MNEVDEFLQSIAGTQPAEFSSYENIFIKYLAINPLSATIDELQQCASDNGLTEVGSLVDMDKDDWLNLLMSHYIDPHLISWSQTTNIYL